MLLELENIHKHFGPVRANNGIDLKIQPGMIHGILGENGAGKSTLMKIMSGINRKTSGTIRIDGNPVDFSCPAEAVDMGIGMLYQEPLDFPPLTVLDNFMLGQVRGFKSNRLEFQNKLERLANTFQFSLPATRQVAQLTIGARQQLEILRLFSKGVRLLILDEPTTGISGTQKRVLFQAMRKLVAQGKSIVIVSHKLEDVSAICDKITVLRQGKIAGEMHRPFDTSRLLQMMFGTLPETPVFSRNAPGTPLLEMSDVSARGERNGLHNCSATIHAGELVGLAGLEGSGQGVFLRLAAGVIKPLKGRIRIQNRDLTGKSYTKFRNAGTVFLPTARLEQGLIPGLTLAEHFLLQSQKKHFFIHEKESVKTAETKIREFRVKGTPQSRVEELSGGNQQRLLLSFLPDDPQVLLLENPTRGLDVESANWVWRHLEMYCAKGKSVVFSSAELDEIIRVAHRVIVFFDGEIVMNSLTRDTEAEELRRAIAGKRAE